MVKRLQTKTKKAPEKGKCRLVSALCNYVDYFLSLNLTCSIALCLHLFDQVDIFLILCGVDWTLKIGYKWKPIWPKSIWDSRNCTNSCLTIPYGTTMCLFDFD